MIRLSPRPNRAHLIKWHEWGDDAFRLAHEQKKPLAVFITAFWCGVCQRMDETSLSHDEVIALLNAFFVPVRVEEAQRPDIDVRYNQEGWPTIAFLSPAGGRIFALNYAPPEEFSNILIRLVDYWQQNEEMLLEFAAGGETTESDNDRAGTALLTRAVIDEIAGMLEGLSDTVNGGFGVDYKYLHTEANEFLLYLYETTGEPSHVDQVKLTLGHIRESKTYDEQAGGFFRYSSRADWQEPHREKLLADQASLVRNYLHTYVLTDEPFYRKTAEELIDFLDLTLSLPGTPAFAGCQDYIVAPNNGDGSSELVPLIDQIVYCDSNAVAVSAYLDAWLLLGREDCRGRAVDLIQWMWENMGAPGGGMYHYVDPQGVAQAPGMLMDAVATGLALLDAYAVLGNAAYLARAGELAEYVLEHHRNADGGYIDISRSGHANLEIPLRLLAQNSTAASFFLRLSDLGGDETNRAWAYWGLYPFPNEHRRHGAFGGAFGHATARFFSPPLTALVRGRAGDPELRALIRAASTGLAHPNLVLRFEAVDAPSRVEIHLGERSSGASMTLRISPTHCSSHRCSRSFSAGPSARDVRSRFPTAAPFPTGSAT